MAVEDLYCAQSADVARIVENFVYPEECEEPKYNVRQPRHAIGTFWDQYLGQFLALRDLFVVDTLGEESRESHDESNGPDDMSA